MEKQFFKKVKKGNSEDRIISLGGGMGRGGGGRREKLSSSEAKGKE